MRLPEIGVMLFEHCCLVLPLLEILLLLEHLLLQLLPAGCSSAVEQLLVLVTHFCWPLKAQPQAVGVFVTVLGHTALHSPLH